jgi:hypothetical protein
MFEITCLRLKLRPETQPNSPSTFTKHSINTGENQILILRTEFGDICAATPLTFINNYRAPLADKCLLAHTKLLKRVKLGVTTTSTIIQTTLTITFPAAGSDIFNKSTL